MSWVTQHALERAERRLGLSRRAAVRRIRVAAERGPRLRPRIAYDLGLLRGRHRRRKGGAVFAVGGSLLAVICREHVVTVLPLELEELARVFVWLMTGHKLGGEGR
jgi:hypothetical protein